MANGKMARPDYFKNHVFENTDFVLFHYCSTRKQFNQTIFRFALKLKLMNNNYFFPFADQQLYINKKKSRLFTIFEK